MTNNRAFLYNEPTPRGGSMKKAVFIDHKGA
jgi:hypothetical protein